MVDGAALAVRRNALEAELCRRSLRLFIEKAWPVIEPDKSFHTNWHIEALCDTLEALASGEADIQELVVNVPPGTMKTLLVSVMFPAWLWATKPGLRFLCASYNAPRAIDAAAKLRQIVESPWYQEHYAVTLANDQNAKTRFNTTKGGYCIATSVGGLGTGEHPDYIFVDDPITEGQSRSDADRKEANIWYDRTIGARGMIRGVKVVVIMQRLHEDDLSGHILSRGGAHHVCFPMRYIPSRPATESDRGYTADPLDPRIHAGQLLWPELLDEAKVRTLELKLGPYGAAGQLQQQPSPEGGGLFKREWFKFIDITPRAARRARGWDTASTEDGGDWTVGVKIAESDGIFYIEDVVREQRSPAGVDALIRQTAEMDGKKCAQREEKEGGSAGKAVVDARAKLLVGYDFAAVSVTGDKVTRSKPFRSQVEAGNVYLVRAPWNNEYLNELSKFPTGNHDDQVDGSSCAFNAVLLEPKVNTRLTW